MTEDGVVNAEECLDWREACCTALERHNEDAVVQVSRISILEAVFCGFFLGIFFNYLFRSLSV